MLTVSIPAKRIDDEMWVRPTPQRDWYACQGCGKVYDIGELCEPCTDYHNEQDELLRRQIKTELAEGPSWAGNVPLDGLPETTGQWREINEAVI